MAGIGSSTECLSAVGTDSGASGGPCCTIADSVLGISARSGTCAPSLPALMTAAPLLMSEKLACRVRPYRQLDGVCDQISRL